MPDYIICPSEQLGGWIKCNDEKMLPPESTPVECQVQTKAGLEKLTLEWYSSWVSERYLKRHYKQIDMQRHTKNLHWATPDSERKFAYEDVLAWKKESSGNVNYFSDDEDEIKQQELEGKSKYTVWWGAGFGTEAKFQNGIQKDAFIKFLKDNKIPFIEQEK